MDINNTPYFLLRTEDEFEQGSSRLLWQAKHKALTLAQNQPIRLPASDGVAAEATWGTATPLALDAFNQIGRLSADSTTVEFNSGRGFLTLKDGELDPVTAPIGCTFKDLNLNANGRLAIPFSNDTDQHGLSIFHLGKRWQVDCPLTAAPLRTWLDENNRAWCISAEQLILCEGEPLPLPYRKIDSRFEPDILNPEKLMQSWTQALPVGLSALAICGDKRQVYILMHNGAGKQFIIVRPLSDMADRPLRQYEISGDTPFAVDIALTYSGQLAALAPRETGDTQYSQRDCVILNLRSQKNSEIGLAELIRERYPMLSQAVPRFVTSADGQIRYQSDVDPDYPDIDPRPRELHALRKPHYHLEANALLHEVMDSGSPNTLWHRVYIDASIPPGCEISLSVRVYDAPDQRSSAELIDQPVPLWMPTPSELAFQQPLSGYLPGQRGHFECLLQRESGPVRRLKGRYLQLQVHFKSNGRQTPSLYAVRVYHPRFSYQEAYLPELFRQEQSFDDNNITGAANGADVRERLLANFEGLLTPIEGKIADAGQLLHPDATPKEFLPWLAQTLGLTLPPHWPESRQRRLLKCATLIQQFKGTLAGVNLALDVATDGGVARGEVVVIENFRLRRTMATILGRNMDDAEHPLTLGTGMSGNSIVGDSLILSDMNAKEFLALFAPELATEKENAAVNKFFELYAHRISVLVHGKGHERAGAITDCLNENMPAHLQWKIIKTEQPFVLGTSPLLSVDTFVDHRPDFEPVELNKTLIGQEGVLKNPAAFSPRDINARA